MSPGRGWRRGSGPWRAAGLVLVGLPIGLQALLVFLYGVNMLVWDEFFYVDFIRQVREGEPWGHWFLLQHNEHRMVPLKIVLPVLAALTGWNLVAEMYASVALVALVVLGLWRIVRRADRAALLAFAPVAWVTASPAQYQNMLFGMQLIFFVTLAAVVWAIGLLARERWWSLLAAVACAFAASLSTVNGLLVWPVGLAVLALERARPSRWIGWLAGAVACFALYFAHFDRPPQVAPLSENLRSPLAAGMFVLAQLGAPLAGGHLPWALALGGVVLLLAGVVLGRLARPGATAGSGGWAALVLFGLVSAGAVAAGRAALGLPQALESRYITFASLAISGLYLWAIHRPPGRAGRAIVRAGGIGVLVVGLVAANVHGFRAAAKWRADRLADKYVLQNFEREPEARLAAIYFPDDLRRAARYMRQAGIGPFADPLDALMFTSDEGAEPAGEVTAARPLRQTLPCPVDVLRDVAVPVITYGRRNPSRVSLAVQLEAHEVARLTVPAAGLRDNGWLKVTLPRAHPCRGRPLTISMESPDGAAGDAISAWTYPAYYAGRLAQAGRLDTSERVLALAVNGVATGLVR